MSDQDSGFTVQDKRKVGAEDQEPAAEKDQPTAEQATEEQTGQQAAESDYQAAGAEQPGGAPLPEMNFATFIISLSTSAMVHLGLVADPDSGQAEVNLPVAKQTIDLLGVLKEKTEGNLDEQEQKLMEGVLYDLRMQFVEASRKQG